VQVRNIRLPPGKGKNAQKSWTGCYPEGSAWVCRGAQNREGTRGREFWTHELKITISEKKTEGEEEDKTINK